MPEPDHKVTAEVSTYRDGVIIFREVLDNPCRRYDIEVEGIRTIVQVTLWKRKGHLWVPSDEFSTL